jgi:hypothetical protein
MFSKGQVNGSRDIIAEDKHSEQDSNNKLSPHKSKSTIRTSTPNKDITSDDIFLWENPLQPSPPPSSPVHYPANMTSSCEEALENSRNPNSSHYINKTTTPVQEPQQPWFLEQQEVLYSQPLSGYKLPPPAEFGGGNPFLVLLCVTLLRQHRDIIMRAHMDYNELAMHLDRMVRKHNVRRVLREARALYRDYLAQYGSKSLTNIQSS